jgi:hypothetical protein
VGLTSSYASKLEAKGFTDPVLGDDQKVLNYIFSVINRDQKNSIIAPRCYISLERGVIYGANQLYESEEVHLETRLCQGTTYAHVLLG